MTISNFLRIALCLILMFYWPLSATGSSKCYYTFDINVWKSAFHVILNNPTTEILEMKYFQNFETYIPFIFDDKGRIYKYLEGRRCCAEWPMPVQIGSGSGQIVRLTPDGRISGIIPNNTYYFFVISKIVSENDYIVSNILFFNLETDYQVANAKIVLWAELPEAIQILIKEHLEDCLPAVGANVSIDYVIDELNIDKRDLVMPVYDLSVYSAADLAYKKKIEKRANLKPQSSFVFKDKRKLEEAEKAYKEAKDRLLRESKIGSTLPGRKQ